MASAASAASAASGEKTVKKINRKPQPTITPFDFEDALESELARHDMEKADMIANMTPQARAEYDKEQAELAIVQAESDKNEEETSRILAEAAELVASPNLDSDSGSHSRLSSSSSTATATATDDDAPPDSDSTPSLTDEDAANAAMEAAILEVGNAPSIHGVFIKTKSNSVPSFTKQTRLVMIDGLGFEWFDEKDSTIKIGSIPLGRIDRASDGGTWGKLFGVDIFHPGVKGQGNNTYLWCKSAEERDRVIAAVNELVKQEKQEAKRVAQEGKEGGNKNRKTIIKYRKRRTIRKNKKGTRTTIRKRQRKNRTMRKKARKSMKARKSRKSNKAR
jgi:hypothetical protein